VVGESASLRNRISASLNSRNAVASFSSVADARLSGCQLLLGEWSVVVGGVL
jgi:hypothetical protein